MRSLLLSVLALGAMACRTQPFAGEPLQVVVDQAHLTGSDALENVSLDLTQSFTVGRSGALFGIEIFAERDPDFPPTTVTLVLRALGSMAPLASAQIGTDALPSRLDVQTPALSADVVGPAYFDFSAFPVPVSAGQQLVFELGGMNALVSLGEGDYFGNTDYPGGNATAAGEVASDADLLFKTFVGN